MTAPPARIFIRTDASREIGSGHVMRCLALAAQLQQRAAQVHFICRELPGHLFELIERSGCILHKLPAGGDQASVARHTTQILEGTGGADWLAVDHYACDVSWEVMQRPLTRSLLVIDDLADRMHDCDLLLDQNLYPQMQTRYDGRVPAGCRLLLGPAYALLRDEFAQARGTLRERDGVVQHLLVFFGGADAAGMTARAVDALAQLPDFSADVIAGPSNAAAGALRAACAALPRTTFHSDVPNMAELLARADLALGAGGSSSWERACLGLPGIAVTVAENQRALTAELAERGCVLELIAEQATAQRLARSVELLASQPALVRHMARNNAALVDGRGAARVARLMLPDELRIRRARAQDCEPMLHWRNHEDVRRHSQSSEPIEAVAHRRWFDASMNNAQRALLIGELAGEPIGVLRYDMDGSRATVSVYLVPGNAGRGLGPALLAQGDAWLKREFPAVGEIHAQILEGNAPSLRAFTDAGYRPHYATLIKRQPT